MLFKKAQDRSVGVSMLIFLVIYFVIFVFITGAAEEISSGSTINSSLAPGKTSIESTFFETCDSPRYKYNPTDTSAEEYRGYGLNNLQCEESKGIMGQNICESIEGCNWAYTNFTYWFFGYHSVISNSSCVGDIDAQAYGINVTNPLIGRPYMTAHNNSGKIGGFIQTNTPVRGSSTNICLHPLVETHEELCTKFSCTWARKEFKISSAGDIMSLTGDIFTFEYDFNFDADNNSSTKSPMGTFMYFIFIIIPIMLLILSIYLIIR